MEAEKRSSVRSLVLTIGNPSKMSRYMFLIVDNRKGKFFTDPIMSEIPCIECLSKWVRAQHSLVVGGERVEECHKLLN